MAVSVLNMQNGIYRRRRVVNRIMLTVSLSTLLFGLFWLFWIILTLLMKGAPRCRTRSSPKSRRRRARPAACSRSSAAC